MYVMTQTNNENANRISTSSILLVLKNNVLSFERAEKPSFKNKKVVYINIDLGKTNLAKVRLNDESKILIYRESENEKIEINALTNPKAKEHDLNLYKWVNVKDLQENDMCLYYNVIDKQTKLEGVYIRSIEFTESSERFLRLQNDNYFVERVLVRD